jgi:hypothetical protein
MLSRSLATAALGLGSLLIPAGLHAQASPAADEIPIERCDRLPVVRARVGATEVRFLLDTGATTMLNIKSFAKGRIKNIQVTSWSGTAATSAREVTIPELALGLHRLQNLKLPAIDLSPIGKACGGPIDGILGVDLLDKMAVTIDLKRQMASLDAGATDARAVYQDMEQAMGHCTTAFEQAKADEFESCLDPEIVLYTPHGEFRGRSEVMAYMRSRFFKFAPDLHYTMCQRDVRTFGDALWYSYDYTLDTPAEHMAGHGMAMCRKSEGHWRMLNMHDSVLEASKPHS